MDTFVAASAATLPLVHASSVVDPRNVATVATTTDGRVIGNFELHFGAVRDAACSQLLWCAVNPGALVITKSATAPNAVYVKYECDFSGSTCVLPVVAPHISLMYECPCICYEQLWRAKTKACALLAGPRQVVGNCNLYAAFLGCPGGPSHPRHTAEHVAAGKRLAADHFFAGTNC